MEIKYDNFPLLHHAVVDENYEVVKAMRDDLPYFSEIVDFNEVDQEWTPLTLSYQVCNLPIAKLLIEAGASPLIP